MMPNPTVLIPLLAFAAILSPNASASKDGLHISFSAPTYSTAYEASPLTFHELPVGPPNTGFNVVIENTSSRVLSLFTDGNSWGDGTLSFLMKTPEGKKVKVHRKLGSYSRNWPAIVILAPGESWVRTVYCIRDHTTNWEGWPQPAVGQRITVTLEAVLEQHREEVTRNDIWDGKVISRPMEFTFVGPKS